MPTRNQKAIDAKKRQALQLKREKPELTQREIANLTGLSQSTVDRVLKKSTQDKANGSVPQAKPTQPSPDATHPQSQTAGPVDFQDSPAPVEGEKKSIVDQGLDTIRGMLGLNKKEKDTEAAPLVAKLDPKRQAFVDNITPTIALGFMIAAGAIWLRIGPEYKLLAPDEKVATKICEPLVRIYARHANFLAEINPDWADLGASLFALVGYVHASLGMYQHIKEAQEDYDYEHGEGAYRAYRTAGVVGAENGTGHANGRRPDVSGAGEAHAGGPGQNGGYVQPVSPGALTPKEQKEFEALSKLAQRDFESRARRSGYFR